MQKNNKYTLKFHNMKPNKLIVDTISISDKLLGLVVVSFFQGLQNFQCKSYRLLVAVFLHATGRTRAD